jgi:biopolymer transport protein ExbD
MRIPTQRRLTLDNDSMTPMIDIVFLLLVFFVCASVGQKPDSLLPAQLSAGNTEAKVELPQQDLHDFPPQEVRIHLARMPSGELLMELNEQPIANATELRDRLQRLAEFDPRSRIILDITDEVSVQQFIAIYDRCQALAFESISFAVHNQRTAP